MVHPPRGRPESHEEVRLHGTTSRYSGRVSKARCRGLGYIIRWVKASVTFSVVPHRKGIFQLTDTPRFPVCGLPAPARGYTCPHAWSEPRRGRGLLLLRIL